MQRIVELMKIVVMAFKENATPFSASFVIKRCVTIYLDFSTTMLLVFPLLLQKWGKILTIPTIIVLLEHKAW